MRKLDQIQNDVLAYFQENASKSMSLKQVSEALGYTASDDFKSLVKVFAQLEQRGVAGVEQNRAIPFERDAQHADGDFPQQ